AQQALRGRPVGERVVPRGGWRRLPRLRLPAGQAKDQLGVRGPRGSTGLYAGFTEREKSAAAIVPGRTRPGTNAQHEQFSETLPRTLIPARRDSSIDPRIAPKSLNAPGRR